MDIGEKVTLRLAELKKSRRQAAIEAGLSPTFVAEVCRGTKHLGIESAKKLAPALDWPVSELLGTEPETEIEGWFWSASIGSLSRDELGTLKEAPPVERVAWSLSHVRSKFPDMPLAELIGTSQDHVERLIAGQGNVSGELLSKMTAALKLPPHWLTLGEPGPTGEQVQRILQHRNAAAWLEVIAEAIDREIPPEGLRRLLAAFVEIAKIDK